MKKISLLLLILLIPFIGHAESKYLYDVLKEEAESNGVATEYAGTHQDSLDATKSTKKIYHWKANNGEDANEVIQKDNLIFGDFCWKMIRTTDTGGVRLVYNGEAVDGKCLDNRENHYGYSVSYGTTSDSVYYGTDYTFDSSTNLFYLSGEVTTIPWTEDNLPNLKNKYTCLSTNREEGCSKILIPYTYRGTTAGYFLSLDKTKHYSIIGNTTYNDENDSPSYAGYMYNKIYPHHDNDLLHTYSLKSLLTSVYYYSDSVTWDPETRRYNLVNPVRVPNSYNHNVLIGKYITQMFSYSNNSIDYVISYYNSSIYGVSLRDGNTIEDYHEYISYANSYTDNGDGTYSLNDYTSINVIDYYSNYANMVNKYYCQNQTGTGLCEELGFIKKTNEYGFQYYDVKHPIKYANGFTYENGMYKLNNDSISYWGLPTNLPNKNTANNYHYTCLNESGECSEIAYIYRFDTEADYILISDGKSVEDALEEMLSADDVNQKESRVKTIIDEWYKRNLLDYTNYLEDTIYCNKRDIATIGGWDPNGGSMFQSKCWLYFGANSLSCSNETDQFTTTNEKAKLKYPVALPTSSEMSLATSSSVRATGSDYMLLDSKFFFSTNSGFKVYNQVVAGDGNLEGKYPYGYGIRPSISLKPKSRYASGDGSKENPYIYDYNDYYSVDVVIKNETKELDIEIEDITKVPEGEEVTFTVTPIKGFKITGIQILDSNDQEVTYQETNNQYTFIMPGEDVTIIPSYERTAAAVNVEDNPHTKEIKIEVNDATAVVYEDVVRFTVEAEEGYELVNIEITDEEGNDVEYHKTSNDNEYEFIMPDTNVLIKPIYREIPKPEEPETKPIINPNTGRRFLWIGILLTLGLLTGTLYKKQKMKV